MKDHFMDHFEVVGTKLQVERSGRGPSVLYLHGEDGLLFTRPFLDTLSRGHEVLAPLHAGWGDRPPHVRSLDDLAYIYLDVLEQLDEPVVLVGTSIGAWLAAEIATKNLTNIAGLVLIAPVGIKSSGREDRAFVDLWANSPDDVRSALYSDPALAPDLSSLTEDDFLSLATAQEAVARFAWEPYMHNPQLPSRLHRISVPTLVVGAQRNGFVLEEGYCETLAGAIGTNAEVTHLDAGHRLEEEQPEALVDLINLWIDNNVASHAAVTKGDV